MSLRHAPAPSAHDVRTTVPYFPRLRVDECTVLVRLGRLIVRGVRGTYVPWPGRTGAQ